MPTFISRTLLFISLVSSSYQITAAPLQNTVQPLLTDTGTRHFSGQVLITKGRAPLYSHNTLPAPSPQFVIGSLSKQITAAIVLQQVEAGKLQLDQPIQSYLPSLRSDWGKQITLAHLLNHTSGLTRPDTAPIHPPGSAFRYSNWGYDLLAQAAEHVSGQSYSVLTQTLFKRCQLTQSFAPSATHPASQAEQLVPGYFEAELGKPKRVENDFPLSSVPSGGIIATATDLAEWNQCLHQSDTVADNSNLLTTATATRQHRWGKLGYSAGLQITRTQAGAEYSHSGYVPGYISTMTYYPAHNVSLVILENIAWYPGDMPRVFGLHDRVRAAVIDSLANNQPQ